MVRFGVYLVRKAGKALFLMVGVSLVVFALYRYFWEPACIDDFDFDRKLYIKKMIRILDSPFPLGYLYYVNTLIYGDWGISLSMGLIPIWDLIEARFPLTLRLFIAAFVLTMCIGVPLGIYAVLRKGTKEGNVLEFLINLCSSTPAFFMALLIPYAFTYLLSSWGLPHIPLSFFKPTSMISFMLAILTIALVGTGITARFMRRATQEVLEQDSIKPDEMKGLSRISIVVRHALKKVLLFPQSAFVSIFSVLLVGVIFAETIFDLPGLGGLFVRSIQLFDYDVMFGLLLFFSLAFIVIAFLHDVLRYFLDPRLRKDAGEVQKA